MENRKIKCKFTKQNKNSMKNVLGLDLNELVSKEVLETINELENDLVEARRRLSNKTQEISKLEKELKPLENTLKLTSYLKESFDNIKADTEGEYKRSLNENRFRFLEATLKHIFNIEKEADGWYHEGGLPQHLAVNYYNNKEVVILLLKVFIGEDDKTIQFIKDFKMPRDYSKEQVLRFVKHPKYNTNGAMFGINRYWLYNGAGETNLPYDSILQNPLMLEEDVFQELINTIEVKRSSEALYLLALSKYNKNVTKEHIIRLGAALRKTFVPSIDYPKETKEFLKQNLKMFDEETIEYFYNFATSDNQYKVLHWENFPNNYQMKFLLSKPIQEVLKIMTSYDCSWTNEEKETFFKQYGNK